MNDESAQTPLLPHPTTARPKPSSRVLSNQMIAGIALVVASILAVGFFSFRGGLNEVDGDASGSASWPTFIGFEGPTPTGSEPLAVATAYPSNHDTSPLRPPSGPKGASKEFNLLENLGNLSPWYSVASPISAEIPSGCQIEQVHLLHRHGARYPTTGAGSAKFASEITKATGWKASGKLSFLNSWKYVLGREILTSFGREQLFNLGVSYRVKYGGLLNASGPKPVFRTESQDRMLKSALNFAAGFFGIPFEDQYHQLITIEAYKFNNTLAPYMTCTNAGRADLNLAPRKTAEWKSIYLQDAVARLNPMIEGYDLTVKDIYNMQELCAYEMVSLGGSAFCSLFTEKEWLGYEYTSDLAFWYAYSFGQPAQAAMGLGWAQEFLARVTKTAITEFNSSTNASYHTEQYFPLRNGQNIFVDATHDTIVSAVITTLDFASFASSGPPPSDHIPLNRSFITAEISPFAANLQAQIISCPVSPSSSTSDKSIRWFLNDALVPLDHIKGCTKNEAGTCALDVYTRELSERLSTIDWAYDCEGNYSMPTEEISDGRPPPRKIA